MTGAARSALSRSLATWRTDFADPASLAALRARILLTTGLGSMASTLSTGLSNGQGRMLSRAEAFMCAMIFLAAVAVFSWYRGARMGDAAFASMIYVGYPVIGITVSASDPTAAIPMVAICCLLATTIGVLFVQRPAIAYVGVGLGVATVTLVAVAVPSGNRTTVEYLTCVLCLTVIGVTMRLVRDLAVSALTRSRRIEATDALTGLQNRRGLERSGAAVWHRAARTRLPLSVLVLDIDHFKRVNDEQGHVAGDEVLRRLGALLNGSTGADDVVVRLGGEEFLVLCSAPAGQAVVLAERLRATVERELGPVTVSIGVHEVLPDSTDPLPTSIWSAVDIADQALYVAKNHGRNRVETAGA